MTERIDSAHLTGERALFQARSLTVTHSIFDDGESPLKEGRDLTLAEDIFGWKYPLWYCQNVTGTHVSLLEPARSGIWYTHHIALTDSVIQAPKTFRRSSYIHLENVQMTHAEETLWHCDDVSLTHVTVNGDYFGMNSRRIEADHLTVTGNYAFDGAEDLHITQSTFLTKDAFWNCRNVVIEDSRIIGEYLGWNSENVTFRNCIIESNQGLCYMDNVTLENCRLIHTDLAFEYSSVTADVRGKIDSVKNPTSGTIEADGYGAVIQDDPALDAAAVQIRVRKESEV